jgi:hypothetical protein
VFFDTLLSERELGGSTVKRIGLKYCGGCNPSYDRVEYVREIQKAAGSRIEWVSLDEGGFATVLLVSGCDKQCVEMAEYEESGCRIIRIKDTCITPSEILSLLLEGDHD